LAHLNEVLSPLNECALKVNAGKSFFARTQLGYLENWITLEGVQPLHKMLKQSTTWLHLLLAQEYARSLDLSTTTLICGQMFRDLGSFNRADIHPKALKIVLPNAFNTMKKIIVQETIMAYSNFKIPFKIYTDASIYQLAAVHSTQGS
jgi:hypothetical protein